VEGFYLVAETCSFRCKDYCEQLQVTFLSSDIISFSFVLCWEPALCHLLSLLCGKCLTL